MPLWLLHGLGTGVGWLTFLASATYRGRFLDNARQAGYSFRRISAAVGAAGRLVAESPRLWFGPPAAMAWEGEALITQALQRGRGIVFLTPHLGCFEATAQGYALRFGRITVLYRPARKPWLRELVDSARARPNLTTVPTTLGGVRQMLRALRSGEAVGLLPDQVPPEGMGEWADFFGRPAYTMTLSARLAEQTGAAVLLAWGERLDAGRGYRIHLREWAATVGAPVLSPAAVNAQMERLIRECPQQYLWGYARYKKPRAGA